jgi:hypothetical protein
MLGLTRAESRAAVLLVRTEAGVADSLQQILFHHYPALPSLFCIKDRLLMK